MIPFLCRAGKVFLVLFCFLFSFPISIHAEEDQTLTQFSTIDALLAGAYEGHMTCAELLTHGNFGLGTFDNLDGEMVVSEGQVFQVRSDGKIYNPAASLTTPFATVISFMPEKTMPVNKEMNLEGIQAFIDQAIPEKNSFLAIRMQGSFKKVRTRSVPAQSKPFPPMTEVTKNQPEFEKENLTGTLLGFRCPPYVKSINIPGYHLHFLSTDHQFGGHVLQAVIENGQVELDPCHRFNMILPEEDLSFQKMDLSVDRSQDLMKAEQE